MSDSLSGREDIEAQCKQLAHDARTIHDWLKPLLAESAVATGAYALKDRLKKWYEIRDKVISKRNHEDPKQQKPDYCTDDVKDASGFRIVRLFNAEVPEALDQLFDFLKAPPRGPTGQFLEDYVVEIEFHSSRRGDDPLSIFPEVKKNIHKHGLEAKFKEPQWSWGEERVSSYSSVHIVVACEVGENENCSKSVTEIQLRSVFEEAWSEISHRLRYGPIKRKRAAGTLLVEQDGTSQHWRHLDALKSLTDGCAQYADLINEQISKHRTSEADRSPQSLTSVEKAMLPFDACENKVREVLQVAFGALETAESAKKGTTERNVAFLQAAETFNRALDEQKASGRPENTSQHQNIIYLIRKRLAHCYMFSDNLELRNQAESIFNEILKEKGDDPEVLLRLGQLRRDAEDFLAALEFLKAGVAAAEAHPRPGLEQMLWVLRRDLAFVCWQIVDLNPAIPEAADLLKRAVVESEEALKIVPLDMRTFVVVNMLYYLVEIKRRVPQEQDAAISRGRELLPDLRRAVDFEKWNTRLLDTVMRAEHVFGEAGRARAAAEVVRRRLQEKISAEAHAGQLSFPEAYERLSHDEKDMDWYARMVLDETAGKAASLPASDGG